VTRATLPHFWRGARPALSILVSKRISNGWRGLQARRGAVAGASIAANARNPGIIRANAARHRLRLAQLS